MKRKLLLIITITLIIGAASVLYVFNMNHFSDENTEIEDLREQHRKFLANSPFKETLKLSKKERKQQGLPPNKYNERQWELNMNPTSGRTEPESLVEVQKQILESRSNIFGRTPGDKSDNNWVERGPNNVGGRTRVVFFDPNDGTNSRVFAGGVSGGLWVTNDIASNGGWTRVADVPGNLNISCYAIDPNDSDTWYLGTGEQYTGGDVVGNGVYKTTDGGVNWVYLPVQLAGGGDLTSSDTAFLSGIYYVNDIVARNNGGNTELYLAVGTHYYTDASNPNNLLGLQSGGLYRSTNDGANWTRNESSVFEYEWSGLNFYFIPNDLEIGADNSIWMGTIRTPGIGVGGGKVFNSSNGTAWTEEYQVVDGNRVEVETSASDANKIYVLAQSLSNPIMVLTTDAFATTPTTVTLPNDPDTSVPQDDFTRNQSFYDLVIEADPTDDDIVYVGGINLHRSSDSGSNWNTISHWATFFSTAGSLVHADQHALTFRPGNSNQAVLGHDGGISFASDLTTTGNNLADIYPVDDNYNVTQFYHMGVAPTTFAANAFLAGAQDNGTSYWSNGSPLGPSASLDISGGDGAYSFFDQVATDYLITNYVYNNAISLFDFSVGDWRTVASNENNEGDFINPQALDSNLDMLYSNGSTGNTFQIFRYEGLTSLAEGVEATRTVLTNAVLDANVTALLVSPYTTGSTTLMLGLEDGTLLRITNADNGLIAWTELTTPFVGSISDIEFGQDETEIFVTMHNYGVTSVWYSDDSGASWSSKEGDLPNMPVKCIMQNPLNLDEVIVGTELGVWYTNNFSDTEPDWLSSFNGMSDVKVTDLQLRNDNTVFAATYGRGVFSGLFTATPLSVDRNEFVSQIKLYPTVSNGDLTVSAKSISGKVNLQVYNLSGQSIYKTDLDFSGNETPLKLTDLSSGIYLVKFTKDDFSETKKIVIK